MVKVDALLDPMDGDIFLTALGASTSPRSAEDFRTPRQRRADALSDIASFLDSGAAAGTEKPRVLVLTDLDALQGSDGVVHETADGMVLTPKQVRQYACDATVSRVCFGRVRSRLRSDRHCRFQGCDRPSRWCDTHNILHWADGGPTALWNLRLLCRYHHTLEHRPRSP